MDVCVSKHAALYYIYYDNKYVNVEINKRFEMSG